MAEIKRSTFIVLVGLALAVVGVVGCGEDEDTTRPVIDTVPPAVPLGVSGLVTDTIHLSWAANTVDTDLAGYIIYRSERQDTGYRPLNREPIPTNSFVDTRAEPGVTYWYSIAARDVNQNESARSAPRRVIQPPIREGE